MIVTSLAPSVEQRLRAYHDLSGRANTRYYHAIFNNRKIRKEQIADHRRPGLQKIER